MPVGTVRSSVWALGRQMRLDEQPVTEARLTKRALFVVEHDRPSLQAKNAVIAAVSSEKAQRSVILPSRMW